MSDTISIILSILGHENFCKDNLVESAENPLDGQPGAEVKPLHEMCIFWWRHHTLQVCSLNRQTLPPPLPKSPLKSNSLTAGGSRAERRVGLVATQPLWNNKTNIKLNCFCMAKERIGKIKRWPMEWEKIFASHLSEKSLISKIYKELTQLHSQKNLIKKYIGLSWWFSGRESAGQCRRHGFQLWSGEIPHTVGQPSLCPQGLSLCSRDLGQQQLKPASPRTCAPQQEKPPQWEARAPLVESSPHSPQLEKTPCSKEDPAQAKNIQIKFCTFKKLRFVNLKISKEFDFFQVDYRYMKRCMTSLLIREMQIKP